MSLWLSVVVPTRDRPEMLDGCLASLRIALREQDELIVVDSASRQPEVRTVAERHGARYIRCDVAGASLARNVGWRQARQSIVAFVDDDVRVSADWAERIGDVFLSFPEVSFVTAKILVPEHQEMPDRPIATMDRDRPMVFRAGVRDLPGHGASLAVRREALEDVGGFDERLGAGGQLRAAEDGDLYDRLYDWGRIGRYEPSVLAWHEQWRSRRQTLLLDFSYGFGTGARVAKLLRTNRVHGLKLAKALYWGWGLLDAARQLRVKAPFLAATAGSRFIGAVAGFLRAAVIPVRDGHFVRLGAEDRSGR